MNEQTKDPDPPSASGNLNPAMEEDMITKFLEAFLVETSRSKGTVKHGPGTPAAAVDSLLGAMLVGGRLEVLPPLYALLCSMILQSLQRLARLQGWREAVFEMLAGLCRDFEALTPFAHRTTVQEMLRGHSSTATDQWLVKNFHRASAKAAALGETPPEQAVNLDPHFVDRAPQCRNQEIKRVMVGGMSTLRTGYQFNMVNVEPLGTVTSVDLAPKRCHDQSDPGNLAFAQGIGKTLEMIESAGGPAPYVQGDRQVNSAGMFATSQNHLWPNTAGDVGPLAPFTEEVMLVTPWVAKKRSKAELLASPNFGEVTVETQEFAANQYSGSQDLATHLRDLSTTSKVQAEVAVVVLEERGGKYCRVDKQEVQSQLKSLQAQVSEQETAAEQAKTDYLAEPTQKGKELTPRGATSKLNANQKGQLPNETEVAWGTRKAYWVAKRALVRLAVLLQAFLRAFHVFAVGVDAPAIEIIKNGTPRERKSLWSRLARACTAFRARWGIETTFESIDGYFPLLYRGTSSATQKRVLVLQCIVQNDYQLRQIEEIKATKPPNWHIWDPYLKCRRRSLRAKDQRIYSTRSYLLERLSESLENYFTAVIT